MSTAIRAWNVEEGSRITADHWRRPAERGVGCQARGYDRCGRRAVNRLHHHPGARCYRGSASAGGISNVAIHPEVIEQALQASSERAIRSLRTFP
jgi:hypothetical protein